ncbi:MAG TPA: TAT-variant-translocated molybdopterin oxidoreductase [Rubricoccaceae bacterium]|nr:TAT-variant-translocated molybdopterin oxidoreductase [Rubricoccaceae bacterium]
MIELDVLSAADVAAAGRPAAWRSREDRTGAADYAAAFRRGEFLPGAADGDDLAADTGTSRRTFLKLMGASMAMAGLTGCRRPVEEILPYARKPEEVLEGVSSYYATAMPMGGVVHALLVQSHEGRPTKVEGNPEHPVSRGATNVFAQASILNLYDPDRSRRIWRRGGGTATWADFVRTVQQAGGGAPPAAPAAADTAATAAPTVTATGGLANAGLAVLAEPTSSPTVERLRRVLEGRGARWITWHPGGDDPAALAGVGRPLYRFSQARVIVSFDADFLGDDANSVWNSREFAASRRADDGAPMSRFYAVESAVTTTGGAADHWKHLRATDVAHFAAAVGQALGVGTGSPGAARYASDPFFQALVEDVRAGGGAAVFAAGPTQPPAVHALCAALNGRYGGGAVSYLSTGAAPEPPVGVALQQLVADMQGGRVQALVMIGTNPVYELPAGLGFTEALGRVPLSIHLGLHRDETARRCTWHLPRQHYLEQWGDGRAYDGTLSVLQPLIAPLYPDSRSEIELLALLATGQDRAGYDLVRETMGATGPGNEDAWRTALHDGFVADTAFPAGGAGGGAAVDLSRLPVLGEDDVEIVFRTCPKVYDGAFANNAWMQELPEPVTKLVWDNVAMMSRHTAERLGVRTVLEDGKHWADTIRLALNGGEATLPVWVQPGHPDGSISVTLGYGREIESDRERRGRGLAARLFDKDTNHYREGPIANGVGANVAPLRRLSTMAVDAVRADAIGRVDGGYLLASTQDHGSMEDRAPVRIGTLEEYRAHPDFAKGADRYIGETPWEVFPPLWGEENSASEDPRIGGAMYSDNQWGMTIDLNACTGCNACVIACQSENNVQIVGKDQVARGREMHWLRMDRYYVGGTADDPEQMVMQPMFCVHCENAPCESVCPVYATSHSPDGINEMTYNRCIGTRYCSNNCPYKVRRFNFYNWSRELPAEVQMAQNPNVTVRFRGVMEKCTYCVQRVRRVQQYAHIENRPIRDGEVQTACQQACASGAIVFGNLADASARVAQLKRNPRSYELLGELATKPRTSFLARLRNPNPRLAPATEADPPPQPTGTREPTHS